MDSLVICIGNPARGDDGVAHRVAELLLAPRGKPRGTRVLSVHQLDVALAEDLARVGAVVFVDAERREEPPARVEPLAVGASAHSVHSVDPSGLLAVAHALYGSSPRAFLVSVAAPKMRHGEGLSGTAEAASVEAAKLVRSLLRGLSQPVYGE